MRACLAVCDCVCVCVCVSDTVCMCVFVCVVCLTGVNKSARELFTNRLESVSTQSRGDRVGYVFILIYYSDTRCSQSLLPISTSIFIHHPNPPGAPRARVE